ncbi:MAG: hypothetical protein IKT00_01755, partial [Prevotella sp.]|nr:hypothetical protein [Prevotella sp.]
SRFFVSLHIQQNCLMMMEAQESATIQLRKEVERVLGRTLKTPKDFNALSQSVFEKTHEQVSASTLKRFWGYQHDAGNEPRKSTLDILARFVDYPDFTTFCDNLPKEYSAPLPAEKSAGKGMKLKKVGMGLLILLALVIFITFAFPSLRGKGWGRGSEPIPVLHQGQTFATYDDYLSLFGLKSDVDHDFFIRLPGYEFTVLWAPRYQHPDYHNEGDSSQMMPTVTEYYHPADYPTDTASMAELAKVNKERYITAIRNDEIRLIFMKNLVDTSFVFLGVYRVSSTLSDTARVVWRRVTTDFDPNHLEVLKSYRYLESIPPPSMKPEN